MDTVFRLYERSTMPAESGRSYHHRLEASIMKVAPTLAATSSS